MAPLLIWNGADGLEKMANAMTADADALSPFTIRVLKNNYISLFHSLKILAYVCIRKSRKAGFAIC